MITASITMAQARRLAHEHSDPLELARTISRQFAALIDKYPRQNIPYVVIGKYLPDATLRTLRDTYAQRDYVVEDPRLVGGHPEDLTWIVDLVYHSATADGDIDPVGVLERRL